MPFHARMSGLDRALMIASLVLAGGLRAEMPPPGAGAGGPRLWEVRGLSTTLNLREAPSMTAPVLTRFPPGARLANMGCQAIDGRLWCEVQAVAGGARGFVVGDFLRPATGPDGAVARGPDDSAERAGRGAFDATGTLACAFGPGAALGACPFGVARGVGGYATVIVTRPDGARRAIFFADGMAVATDRAQSDGPGAFRAVKEGDLNRIFDGEDRYEMPDAVPLGG